MKILIASQDVRALDQTVRRIGKISKLFNAVMIAVPSSTKVIVNKSRRKILIIGASAELISVFQKIYIPRSIQLSIIA